MWITKAVILFKRAAITDYIYSNNHKTNMTACLQYALQFFYYSTQNLKSQLIFNNCTIHH